MGSLAVTGGQEAVVQAVALPFEARHHGFTVRVLGHDPMFGRVCLHMSLHAEGSRRGGETIASTNVHAQTQINCAELLTLVEGVVSVYLTETVNITPPYEHQPCV